MFLMLSVRVRRRWRRISALSHDAQVTTALRAAAGGRQWGGHAAVTPARCTWMELVLHCPLGNHGNPGIPHPLTTKNAG